MTSLPPLSRGCPSMVFMYKDKMAHEVLVKRHRRKTPYLLLALVLLFLYAANSFLSSPRGASFGKRSAPRVLSNSTTRVELEVRPSTIPGAAMGLFTKVKLTKGDFIGFFCGDVYDKRDKASVGAYEALPDEKKEYALDPNSGVMIVPDTSRETDRLGYMNEPPDGVAPNVDGHPYKSYSEELGKTLQFNAFYAITEIEADGEIFWYYGPGYKEHRERHGYPQPAHQKQYFYQGEKQDPLEVLRSLPLDRCSNYVVVKKGKQG